MGDQGIYILLVVSRKAGVKTEARLSHPTHSKEHVKRDVEFLRAVDVTKTDRIRDDGVRDERCLGFKIGFDAGVPCAGEDFGNHFAFAADIAGNDGGDTRKKTRIWFEICKLR